jgi:uncharacterized damage-inducible protein DinB
MEIISILLEEMDQEAKITRKMLARIPNDKYDWQPHPKSMTIKQLANHIAELLGWVTMAFTTNGLDFETNPYEPTHITNTGELLAYFETIYTDGRAHLENATEDQLSDPWILSSGEHVLQNYDRLGAIRVAYSQTIHHRAQLGVFLRLLDVRIPGSYGPSADEGF